MKHDYRDIIDRAGPPDYYDENGTPRYGQPTPADRPDIYADFVAVALVRCQNCGQQFRVMMSDNKVSMWRVLSEHSWTEAELPDYPHGHEGFCCYGTPPRHGDPAGNTMMSEPVAILEFWRQTRVGDWERVAEREGVWRE